MANLSEQGRTISRRNILRRSLGVFGIVTLGSSECIDESTLDLGSSATSKEGWRVRYPKKAEGDFEDISQQAYLPNGSQVLIDGQATGIKVEYRGYPANPKRPSLFVDTPRNDGNNDQYKLLKQSVNDKVNTDIIAFANVKNGTERYLIIVPKPESLGFLVVEAKKKP